MPPATRRPKRVRGTIIFRICRRICRITLRTLWHIRWIDAHHVPRKGPVLIVSNHQSHLDPPAVGCGPMFRPTAFVARDTLFKNPAFGWLLRNINALPIKRDEADTTAIRDVLERLESGGAVVMFPEGTRSPEGCIKPFKRGMGLLLKKARCPVVPVGIDGFTHTWPRNAKRPHLRGRRLAVVYGKPFDPEDLLREGPDAALIRVAQAIDSLRLEARAILWQDTNGMYPPGGAPDAPLNVSQFVKLSGLERRSVDRDSGASTKPPQTTPTA
jgi:1-acyl-sn-glycerol-3-phosphate acyltransferase